MKFGRESAAAVREKLRGGWRKLPGEIRPLLAVVLTVVLFFVILRTGLDVYGQVSWDRFRQKWEERGVVFDYAHYERKPLPEDDFLAAPIVKKWVDQDSGVYPALTEWPKGISGYPLDQGSWQKGNLAGLGEYLGKPAMSDEEAAEVILAKFAPVDPIFEELAEATKRSSIRRDFEFYGIGKLNQHVQIVRLRARSKMRTGRPQEAIDEIGSAFRLAAHFRDRGAIVPLLVQISLLGKIEDAVWDGLRLQAWDDAQLRQLEVMIDELKITRGFADKVMVELSRNDTEWRGQDLYRGVRRDARLRIFKYFEKFVNQPDRWDSLKEMGNGAIYWIAPEGFFDLARKTEFRVYIDSVLWDGQKMAPELTAEQVDRFEAMKAGPLEVTLFVDGMVGQPWPRKVMELRQRYDLIRLAIALERFALAEGNYPDRLEKLAPNLIDDVPRKRFDPDREIGYGETADGRYRLTVIGQNGIDKGPDSSFQWVWQYFPREIEP